MTVLQLGFWCRLHVAQKVKYIYNADKNSIKISQIILKMTEKRTPPVGAFKLNPLKTLSTADRQMSTADSPKSLDEKDVNIDILEDAEMKQKDEHVVNTTENISEDPKESRNVKKDDSAVMMKMIISGPPSLAKKQRVLPESLLQKVTEIVRQQTESRHDQDSVNEEAFPQDTSSSCSLSTSSILEKSLNKDMAIAQSVTQSLDNGSKQSPSIVLQCTTVVMSDDNKSNTSIGSDSLSTCLSCSSFNHDMETNECLIMTTGSILDAETDMDLDASQDIKEICGPPDSFMADKGKIESNVTENGTGICLNKTLDSQLSSDLCSASSAEPEIELDSDQAIKEIYSPPDSIEKEVVEKKETVLDISKAEMETDPFGGLFLDEEEVGGDKIKPVKDTDEVYNIAPLFSGELEKWRKRKLKTKKKKSFKNTKKSGSHVVEGTAGKSGGKDEGDRQKERRLVPNYFVAIQITDTKIHDGLQRVQEDVIAGNEKLKPALNKLATLHLTMFVVHLKTENEMSRAREALNQCQKKLEPLYKQQLLSLDVSGLGHFRNSVVFAKVKAGDQIAKLKEIADIVEDCFLDQEIVSTEKSGSFKPHITVMKLTRDKSFRKKGGIKKINEALYKDHLNKEFGRQYVNTLQLCAMLKKKTVSGYYQVEHSVQFGPDISENIALTPICNRKDVSLELDIPLTDTDDAAKATEQNTVYENLKENLREEPNDGSCNVMSEPSTDTDNVVITDGQQSKSENLTTTEESNYGCGNGIADTETPKMDVSESDDREIQAAMQTTLSENLNDTHVLKDGYDNESADKETPGIKTTVSELKEAVEYKTDNTNQGASVIGFDVNMEYSDAPSNHSDSGLDLEDSVSFDSSIKCSLADTDIDTSEITETDVLEESKDIGSTDVASKDLEDICSATKDSKQNISADPALINSSEIVIQEEIMDTDKSVLSDKLEDSGIDSSANTT